MVTSGKQLHMQVHTTSSDLDVAELFLLQNPAWEEQGSVGYIPHRYVPRPWRYSRSGWMGFWATWCSCRCPCSLQMTFKGPFQLKHVYDSMIGYILQYSKVVLCDQRLHWPKGCPSHPEIGRLMHGEVAPLQAEQAKQRCSIADSQTREEVPA